MESNNYQEDLSHIRSMMERSSRFISLSGLSGVFAGLVALLGAVYVYFVFRREGVGYFDGQQIVLHADHVTELVIVGFVILILAVFGAYFFSSRKSKKIKQPMWNTATRNMLADFAVPLVTGAVFCFALLFHNLLVYIAPATLVFYGLALISAEKHTLSEIKYLGFCQVILGLLSMFFLGWGLLFWALGFGVLHIVYGWMMYSKEPGKK